MYFINSDIIHFTQTILSNFNKVSIFVRTVSKISDEKLTIHKIDFAKLEEYKDLIKNIMIIDELNRNGTYILHGGPHAGSKHSHLVQYLVLTSGPQQSPPSHSHPSVLFSSSHHLSPLY